jgi:hypothetical protein
MYRLSPEAAGRQERLTLPAACILTSCHSEVGSLHPLRGWGENWNRIPEQRGTEIQRFVVGMTHLEVRVENANRTLLSIDKIWI